MKHFIFLLVVSLIIYFTWFYMAKKDKRVLKKFGIRHMLGVLVIIVFCTGMLLLMFFNRAVSIL